MNVLGAVPYEHTLKIKKQMSGPSLLGLFPTDAKTFFSLGEEEILSQVK